MNCWGKAAFTAVFTIPSIRKIKSDRNSGRILLLKFISYNERLCSYRI